MAGIFDLTYVSLIRIHIETSFTVRFMLAIFSGFCLHFFSSVSKWKFGLLFFEPVEPESKKVRLGNEMCKKKHPLFIKELET